MADKDISIKITTEADTNDVKDLKQELQDLNNNTDVNVNVHAETGEIDEAKTEIESIDNEQVEVEIDVDTSSIESASDSISDLNSNVEVSSESATDLNSNLDFQTNSISEASSTSYDLSRGLAMASDESQNLEQSMSLLTAGAMLDIANQMGQIGQASENMAQQMNNSAITVGQLATNTGVAEPQMRGLVEEISNVTFPQNEAMQYINALNQMGVSADEFGESATNMDRINDAFGIGSDNVVKLSQGLRTVGVDANNLDSSFNALAYTQANVSGGVQTYSMVLQRQGALLNEYGLNADQVAVILGNLSDKGLSQRQITRELSSALKDANGDTRALEESLGLQAGTLSNASQETGNYAGKLQDLADEEMEHKTITERLGAVWEDLSLELEPVLSPLASFIGLIGSIGQTALAINSIITLAETFGILETANLSLIPSQIAEGTAGWFSIGWIAVAILLGIALGLAIIYLYNHSEVFRNAIDSLGQTIQWLVGTAWSLLSNFLSFLQGLGANALASVGITSNGIVNTVVGLLIFISTLPARLGVIFINMIARALGFGNNFTGTLRQSGVNAVNGFINSIMGLPSWVQSELSNIQGIVQQWANTLPQKFWDAGVNAVKNFLNALGIHSPGYMQVALLQEVEDTGDRIPDKSRNLLRNVNTLGNDIVDEFGNPTLSYDVNGEFANQSLTRNNNDTGNMTWNVTLNVGSVDKQERVNEIIDTLEHYIKWDNTTAGRTN